MTIDEVYRLLQFISNKTQRGVLVPAQFNLIAPRAQLDFFLSEAKIWQENQEITDALGPFLVPLITTVPPNGRLLYPANYFRVSSIRRIYFKNNISKEVPIVEINDDEIGDSQISTIVMPTLKRPKYAQFGGYTQFFPKNVGAVIYTYLRKPVTPVWGFTVVNNRPVYNPATSVDFEFLDQYQDRIVMNMLSLLGVNIREAELTQYAQAMKEELS